MEYLPRRIHRKRDESFDFGWSNKGLGNSHGNFALAVLPGGLHQFITVDDGRAVFPALLRRPTYRCPPFATQPA